jgi:hypothetical protein
VFSVRENNEIDLLRVDESVIYSLFNALMSSMILRSVVAGLTTCMFLVLFSGCGSDKSSKTASPSDWPASTWSFTSSGTDEDSITGDDGETTVVYINDRFTFSGGNSGMFNRTVSTGGPTGNYTYSKTGSNTGVLLLNFGGGYTSSVSLIFSSPTSGTGSVTVPPGTTDGGVPIGGRIYQITFTRI